jgi:hypothetical protein
MLIIVSRNPGRYMQKTRGWVHPKDRVERWFFWKGDKVRVLRGPDHIKYNNPEYGEESGYRIYTIAHVDQKLNKVYLKELPVCRGLSSCRVSLGEQR